MLNQVGLEHLIAESPAEYVDIAARLASDVERPGRTAPSAAPADGRFGAIGCLGLHCAISRRRIARCGTVVRRIDNVRQRRQRTSGERADAEGPASEPCKRSTKLCKRPSSSTGPATSNGRRPSIDRFWQSNPRHAPTLHLLGTANFQLGQYQLAVEQLRAAIRIDGKRPESHAMLIEVLRASGRSGRGDRQRQPAGAIDARLGRGSLCLGSAAGNKRRLAGAAAREFSESIAAGARSSRGLAAPGGRRSTAKESWTRPACNSKPPRGCIRNRRGPIAASGRFARDKASWTRPSPRIAARSSSIPICRRHTTTWEWHCNWSIGCPRPWPVCKRRSA